MKLKRISKNLLIACAITFALTACKPNNNNTTELSNTQTNNTGLTTTLDTTTDALSTTTIDTLSTTTTDTLSATTTQTTTSTTIEETVLKANNYYLSNDNEIIVRADTKDNQLSNFIFYSSLLDGAYFKPIIKDGQFESVAVININIDDELCVKTITKDMDYALAKNISLKVDSFNFDKPLLVMVLPSTLVFKFDTHMFTVNVDGTINEVDDFQKENQKTFTYDNKKFYCNNSEIYTYDYLNEKTDITHITLSKDLYRVTSENENTEITINDSSIFYTKDTKFEFAKFNILLDSEYKIIKETGYDRDDSIENEVTYEYQNNTITRVSRLVQNKDIAISKWVYDPDTFLITEYDFEASSEYANFKNSYKYTYDNHNCKTINTIYEYNSSTYHYNINEDFTFEYENGLLTKFAYDRSDGKNTYLNTYLITYDDSNSIKNIESYEDGVLTNSIEYIKTDNTIEFINKTINGDTISYDKDVKLTFDDNSNVIKREIFDSSKRNIKNYDFEYQKDNNNNIITIIPYIGVGSEFINYSKDIITIGSGMYSIASIDLENNINQKLYENSYYFYSTHKITIQEEYKNSYTYQTKTISYLNGNSETTTLTFDNDVIKSGEKIVTYKDGTLIDTIEYTYNANVKDFLCTSNKKIDSTTQNTIYALKYTYYDDGEKESLDKEMYETNKANQEMYFTYGENTKYNKDGSIYTSKKDYYKYDSDYKLIHCTTYYTNDTFENLIISEKQIINGELTETTSSTLSGTSISSIIKNSYETKNNKDVLVKIENYFYENNQVINKIISKYTDGELSSQEEYKYHDGNAYLLNRYIATENFGFAISLEYDYDEETYELYEIKRYSYFDTYYKVYCYDETNTIYEIQYYYYYEDKVLDIIKVYNKINNATELTKIYKVINEQQLLTDNYIYNDETGELTKYTHGVLNDNNQFDYFISKYYTNNELTSVRRIQNNFDDQLSYIYEFKKDYINDDSIINGNDYKDYSEFVALYFIMKSADQ